MDTLIASANSLDGRKDKRTGRQKPKDQRKKVTDPEHADGTLASITRHTRLPPSLVTPGAGESSKSNSHIRDRKLRNHLNSLTQQSQDAKALRDDAELLMTEEGGRMVAEGEMEKSWRITQDEIVKSVGEEQSKGRMEWKLDGGPYRVRYARNGRHLAIAGQKGHVASFDWQTGKMHCELQLQETIRDITYLHDHFQIAVAQKKHVFIYDQDGVELHRLSSHIEVNRLEYLPYHWLLVSIGNPGYLKYQDTSTGKLVTEQRTKLGACRAMAQNPHNAVIYLGHQNGTTTLHTPNLPTPPVTMLAHMGGITSLSVDPSSGGRYLATAGLDCKVKVWDCRNWKGCVREWSTRGSGGGAEIEWSAKGFLGVASSGSVNVYTPPTIISPHKSTVPPPLYLTHSIPSRPLTSLRFCPYTDVLTTGHAKGLGSILVPGAGEPNFDSSEADPFESSKSRREREIRSLLDKIQPDLISLEPDFLGKVEDTRLTFVQEAEKSKLPFSRLPRLDRLKVSGKADETEEPPIDDGGRMDADGEGDASDSSNSGDEAAAGGAEGPRVKKEKKEKKKMRGKGKSLQRYLRKKRKNVIDPSTVAIRAKIEVIKEQKRAEKAKQMGAARGEDASESIRKPSALDRFRK